MLKVTGSMIEMTGYGTPGPFGKGRYPFFEPFQLSRRMSENGPGHRGGQPGPLPVEIAGQAAPRAAAELVDER